MCVRVCCCVYKNPPDPVNVSHQCKNRRRRRRLDFYHLMIRCKFCYWRIISDTLCAIKFNEQWQIWSSVNWLIMDACVVRISWVVSMFLNTSPTAWACVNGAKINSLSSVIVWCGERCNKINHAPVQNQYLLIKWNEKLREYLRFYRLKTTWAETWASQSERFPRLITAPIHYRIFSLFASNSLRTHISIANANWSYKLS